MELEIQRDGSNQPCIEWEQANGHFKRAWIQRKSDPDKDWASAPRYLNVVRCEKRGRPAGNATDFPVFTDLPDEQILRTFVHMTCALAGHPRKDDA